MWVEGSVKPFHNEVSAMARAPSECVCVSQDALRKKFYIVFERISWTEPLGGLQAAASRMQHCSCC